MSTITKKEDGSIDATVTFNIPDYDVRAFVEINRRMGGVYAVKMLRMAYPMLTLAQANDINKLIREDFKDEISH